MVFVLLHRNYPSARASVRGPEVMEWTMARMVAGRASPPFRKKGPYLWLPVRL